MIKRYLSVIFKGVCMGAADVVPGVSGGTIAFLMGIYKELIDSIKSVDKQAFTYLLKLDFKSLWQHINGNFLLSVFTGILISVFSIAKLMKYLLEFHPIELWSFFFGLILASAIYILKGLDKWNMQNIISLIVGVAIAAYICLTSPAQTPNDLWFIFLSGAIAICAMILPGISGSFILVLLGKYEYIMGAVTDLNIVVLGVFAVGAAIGILSFSRLLSWLLKRFYMQTIALLSGFMIGSLIKVWPWREVEGVEMNGSLMALSIVFVIIGLALVFGIEYIAKKERAKKINL